MSRIDDDIDDRREAELLYKQLLQQEILAKKKQSDGSEFDRRMKETNVQRARQAQKEGEHQQHQEAEQHRDPLPGELQKDAQEKARDTLLKVVAAARAQKQTEDVRSRRGKSDRQLQQAKERTGRDTRTLAEKRE